MTLTPIAPVSGLLRAGLRIVLAALMITALAGCKESLYTQLTEAEANEMIAVLSEHGITSEKAPGEERTWQLRVSSGQFAEATRLLNSRGLPRERFESMGNVFRKDSLVSTPNAERIRYIYALSQELSNTLSRIDGVVMARVQPVLPANDPFATQLKPASASVFIKHRPDVDLSLLAPAIKEHVMASIEGLEYERISLSFFPSEVRARPAAAMVPASATGARASLVTTLSTLFAVVAVLALAVGIWTVRHSLRRRWSRGAFRSAPGNSADPV